MIYNNILVILQLTILASEILLSNTKLIQFRRTSSRLALLSTIRCLSTRAVIGVPMGTILTW